MSSSPLSRRAGALGLLAAGTMFFAAAASAATPRHTQESFGPFAIEFLPGRYATSLPRRGGVHPEQDEFLR